MCAVLLIILCCRWWQGRPLHARLGKRTLVIVDMPMVHQLTEVNYTTIESNHVVHYHCVHAPSNMSKRLSKANTVGYYLTV
jgi:hypothetical protein